MSQAEKEKKEKKEAMKQLRAARKERVSVASAIMKQQKKDIASIKEQIQNNVGTVPLIADATGIPASDVLWYIAALKKYGEISEGEKDGSYFQYVLCRSEGKREEAHDIG